MHVSVFSYGGQKRGLGRKELEISPTPAMWGMELNLGLMKKQCVPLAISYLSNPFQQIFNAMQTTLGSKLTIT